MAETNLGPEGFSGKVNKDYGYDLIKKGGKFSASSVDRRFSSGIITLDVNLGGGWPFGKMSLIAGAESSGKTLLTLKACGEIKKYDRKTKLKKDLLPNPTTFSPCRTLFIDVEGTMDLDWSEVHGFDGDLDYVARPEYSEQVGDIVTNCIRENAFDLIIIDSIAAMTPMKEIEESSESWQMGLAARLNNKNFRSWQASLNRIAMEKRQTGPTILLLNQFRYKIGLLFGDPRVLPGGEQQKYSSSIILYTDGAKYEDDSNKENAMGEYGGTAKKNKTYVPKMKYKFKMALKDTGEFKKGQVDNVHQMMELGKKHQVFKKRSGSWVYPGDPPDIPDISRSTQRDLMDVIKGSPKTQERLWRDIVRIATGVTI
jgi:recombination protein RecA